MQTSLTAKCENQRTIRNEKTVIVEHDIMGISGGKAIYGGVGGVGSPLVSSIGPSCKALSIVSDPMALLSVSFDSGNEAKACSSVLMSYPCVGEVSVGTYGNIKGISSIISATLVDNNTKVDLVVNGDGLNYTRLVGAMVSGPFSLNGEYFYFIFGDYSEQQVFLEDVGILDEDGVHYEYDGSANMTELDVTYPALAWSRVTTTVTITHVSHGHTDGDTVAISLATDDGVSAEDVIPSGDYVISGVTDDTYNITVSGAGTSTSGLLVETYTYGTYNSPSPAIVAEAMERCINAMFATPVVTVDYEYGAIVIRSVVIGCTYMYIVSDYASVSNDLGFTSGQMLYPALDVTGYYVYARGIPLTPILSASGNTIRIAGASVDGIGGELLIVDTEGETDIEIMQSK